jgi:hypothetical protein
MTAEKIQARHEKIQARHEKILAGFFYRPGRAKKIRVK